MIQNLIREREQTQYEAIREVSSKWAEEQTISGPYLSIPYYKYVRQYSSRDSTYKVVMVKDYMHFLPSDLKIKGEISPEKRNRGIYDIVVYNSKLHIGGTFDKINFSNPDIPRNNILFDKAFLSIGISDLRGIEKQIDMKWNENDCTFNPGTVTTDIIGSGINTPVKIENSDSLKYSFSFDLDLKGSQKLYFIPVGEVTDLTIDSKWKNPSFNGSFLPDSRTVSDSGFSANWNILHLNRNFPQNWVGNSYSVNESAFGIDLILPVDNYQKSTRATKYAILFIIFTFITFFFVEILKKVFIHPVQYILVGIALIVFYTLLLSISEYLSFNYAFIVSALATILLIFGYVKAILKSFRLSGLVSGIITLLYTFIFVIIQLQDFALLIGSLGVFMILAIIMYFSRKIDWYNLNMKEEIKE